MSKTKFNSYKKNSNRYYDEDEEEFDDRRNRVNKHKEKRINRALRTKDIGALLEEDELDDFELHNSTFEQDKY